MKFLSKAEVQDWCRSRGIPLDERDRPQPHFDDHQGYDFAIPSDAGARIALVNRLGELVPANQEAMLWITEWGIWPSGERRHLFDRFRMSYGEQRRLMEIPAFVFDASEREDLLSFLTFPILFLYDCHLLTASGDTWIFLSHDEVGWACSREPNGLGPIKAFK